MFMYRNTQGQNGTLFNPPRIQRVVKLLVQNSMSVGRQNKFFLFGQVEYDFSSLVCC